VGDDVVHQAGLDVVVLVSIYTRHILPQGISQSAILSPAGVAAEQLPEALQLSCSAFKLLLNCLQSAQPAAASAVQQQLLPQLPMGLGGSSESRNSGSSSFWASDVQQVRLQDAWSKDLCSTAYIVRPTVRCTTSSACLVQAQGCCIHDWLLPEQNLPL
jgi:hypothetical protein